MSENSESFITYKELSGADKSDPDVRKIRQIYGARLDTRITELKALSKPMPERLANCVDDLKSEYEKHFSKFGIKQIHWPENIFYTDVSLGDPKDGVVGGYLLPGVLIAREYLGVRFDETSLDQEKLAKLKQFTAAVFFTHELFHATSQPVFAAIEHHPSPLGRILGKKDALEIRQEKVGLGYIRSKKRGRGFAVEEGLAMKMENKMEEVLVKHYPEETQMLRQLKVEIAKILDDPKTPIESINPLGDMDESEYECYPGSVNLVNFLELHVPEFEKLAMRARVLHETLPLVRKVEAEFGKGSYSLIMQSNEQTAPKVQKMLEKRLKRKT